MAEPTFPQVLEFASGEGRGKKGQVNLPDLKG